jgi:hypothetical protein
MNRIGFTGLDFTSANDLLETGLEHFGMSELVNASDIASLSKAQDADGDNQLFKTEFLLAAKSLAEYVNTQL